MVKEEISGKDRGGRQRVREGVRGRETQRDRENKKIINIMAYAFIIAGTRDHGNRGVLFKEYACVQVPQFSSGMRSGRPPVPITKPLVTMFQ